MKANPSVTSALLDRSMCLKSGMEWGGLGLVVVRAGANRQLGSAHLFKFCAFFSGVFSILDQSSSVVSEDAFVDFFSL